MTEEEKKYLASGGALSNGKIPTLQAITDKETAPITSEALNPATPITIPQTPTDTTDWSAMLKGINAESSALTSKPTETNDWMSKLLSMTEKPESLTGLYDTTRTTTGMDTKEQAVVESQKQLDLLNAQMAGLTAEAQAVPIRLQQESVGRGITKGGLAPIETGQLRDIALRALPLQAQILAQQAVVTGNQGTLKLAQDKLNTLFTLKSKDIENAYNYRKDSRDKIWDYATIKEKQKLDAQQKVDDRNYDKEKTNWAKMNEWSKLAITNGQSDLITQINALDPTSKDFDTKLGAITSKIVEKKKAITPLSILDIQRYEELYPDAGIVAGDTEEIANQKVNNLTKLNNSPEVKLKNLITSAKDNGNSYDTVITEIEGDNTITDKESAKTIAKEVFGITEKKPFSLIENPFIDSIARFLFK